jgi:hypothetical protein
VFQHLEEYLTGDIIGVVACQDERLPLEEAFYMHLEEIIFYNVIFQLGIILPEVIHRLKVQFHYFQLSSFRDEELSEYTHSRAYFQDREAWGSIYGVCYGFRYFQVFQKVLP